MERRTWGSFIWSSRTWSRHLHGCHAEGQLLVFSPKVGEIDGNVQSHSVGSLSDRPILPTSQRLARKRTRGVYKTRWYTALSILRAHIQTRQPADCEELPPALVRAEPYISVNFSQFRSPAVHPRTCGPPWETTSCHAAGKACRILGPRVRHSREQPSFVIACTTGTSPEPAVRMEAK